MMVLAVTCHISSELPCVDTMASLLRLSASSSVDTEIDIELKMKDIGEIIAKVQNQQALGDDDREQALHQRWIPCTKADLQFSVHTTKNDTAVRRYLGDGF